MDLEARLAERGRALAEREDEHAAALSRAHRLADVLHAEVARGLEAYHRVTQRAPQLAVELGDVAHDAKHLHAFEFDVRRGRHRAIVVVKSRGEVTLVGPFHMGKDEGPCRRIPVTDTDPSRPTDDLMAALGDLLESFLEEATAP